MKLLVDPEWTLTDAYLDIYAKQSRDISSEKKTLKADLEMMRERAAKIYEEQCQRYDEKRDMTLADREWNRKVLTEGTISDKISAFLIQIRESPFYSMQAIAQLLALAGGASRHESYPALEAIGNVFATCILPAPSKLPENQIEPSLRSFMSRTDLSPDKNETPMRVILQAYYEDLVKTAYLEFLKILEIILHDQVQAGREFAMRTVKDLLVAGRNASSENVLLRLLVNKLGDHSRKVASRVSFYLQNVVDTHERLTLPTVQLVQDEITKASAVALYRPPSAKDIKKRPKLSKSKLNSKPSGNDKPAYYGLCFFSQLRLSSDTPDVTRVLLKTYQYLLEVFISRLEEPLGKGKHSKNKRSAKDLDENDAEEAPRIIKVVLTGLSRAIPFYPSVAGNSMMTSNKAENLSLTAYVSRIMDIAKKIRSYPILLQASNLILRIFSAPGQKNEESFSVLSRMASENLLDCTRMADALASHPLLFKLLYRLFTFLGESSSPAATKAMQTLCKSLLASACAIQSPAFPAAALLLVNEAFSLKPELRLSVSFPADQAVEYDEIITSNSNIIDHKKTTETTLWELCLLASHCNPTVRRYARTLLSNDPQNNQIDIRNEPEDPFLSLSNGPFLETLIRGNGGSGGGNKKEVYNGQGSDVQDR